MWCFKIDPTAVYACIYHIIRVINFYIDMWEHRSDISAPLNKMTFKQDTYNWTEEHSNAFEQLKTFFSRQTLSVYLNFIKPFVTYTDASWAQFGSVISQDNKSIAVKNKVLQRSTIQPQKENYYPM